MRLIDSSRGVRIQNSATSPEHPPQPRDLLIPIHSKTMKIIKKTFFFVIIVENPVLNLRSGLRCQTQQSGMIITLSDDIVPRLNNENPKQTKS